MRLYASKYGLTADATVGDTSLHAVHAAGDPKSQCKGVAIGEGRIYSGNYSGKLYCLENGE